MLTAQVKPELANNILPTAARGCQWCQHMESRGDLKAGKEVGTLVAAERWRTLNTTLESLAGTQWKILSVDDLTRPDRESSLEAVWPMNGKQQSYLWKKKNP